MSSRIRFLILPLAAACSLLLIQGILLRAEFTSHAAQLNPSTFPPFWQITCLDCPASFKPGGDRYLQLDPSGTPHMVYTGEGLLYHAWRAAGGWQVEVISVEGLIYPPVETSVSSAALAFDSQGILHIAFILNYPGNSTLYLYTRCSTSSMFEIIRNFTGSEASVTSLGIDSGGYVHVPFYDSASQQLRYAFQTPTGWQSSTIIDSGESIGLTTSFALDSQRHGHMAYYANKAGGGLRYARMEAGGWYTETVVAENVGLSLSLDLDGDENPHISYDQLGVSEVRHAYLDQSGWHLETIAPTGLASTESSLAFYPDNAPVSGPCVAFGNTLTDQLMLACRTAGGAWLSQSLAEESNQAPSLLFDPDGNFQVAHFSNDTGWLQWTQQTSSSASENVAKSVKLDGPVAIETDLNGYAHVLYHQTEPTHTVRLAVQGAGGWQTSTVTATLGICEGMALDSTGNMHLTCVTPSNTLIYAHLGASGWQIQTIDRLGVIPAYSSITVDGNDHVHLSYADGLDDHLIYGNNETGSVVTETANAAYSGAFTSLALTSGGEPYISYINPAGNAEVAYRGAGGWQIIIPYPSLVENAKSYLPLAESKFTSLALDASDRIHLVYMEYLGTCRLRYNYQDLQGWHTEIIAQDSSKCSGVQPTLKLDDAGYPLVAYHVEFDKDSSLNFAYKDQQGWHRQTVDSHGGESSWLALGLDGKKWIAYLDFSFHDVKLAYTLPGYFSWLPFVAFLSPF